MSVVESPPPAGSTVNTAITTGIDQPSSQPGDKQFSQDLHDKFEEVYTRLTKGRHDLKQVKAYMEERAKAEEVYARLLKNACALSDFEETTSISHCWKDLKDTGTSLSRQHDQFGVMCTEIAKLLDNLIHEVKKIKTSHHTTYKNLVSDRQRKSDVHNKSKTAYYDAVKAAETAVLNRDTGRQQNQPDKQISKLEAHVKKTAKDVETSHAQYQKSVSALQEAQRQYDAQVKDMLYSFEKLERQRLKVMTEQIQRFTQQHDFLKSSLNQLTLFMSKGIDGINIAKDIQDFIKQHFTGNKPAPHVQYEPCRSQIINHFGDASVPSSPAAANSEQKTSSAASNHVTPNAPTGMSIPVGNGASGKFGQGARAPPAAPVQPTAVALYDFESTEADDLPFKVGDVINLTACPDSEDWWHGTLNGRNGMFPKNYVAKDGIPQIASTDEAAQSQSSEGETPRLMDARCEALFDFEGQDADELSFHVGEQLIITGELNGWYLGKNLDGTRVGIFPANYVRVL